MKKRLGLMIILMYSLAMLCIGKQYLPICSDMQCCESAEVPNNILKQSFESNKVGNCEKCEIATFDNCLFININTKLKLNKLNVLKKTAPFAFSNLFGILNSCKNKCMFSADASILKIYSLISPLYIPRSTILRI